MRFGGSLIIYKKLQLRGFDGNVSFMGYWILFIVPKKLLSRIVGWLAEVRWPKPLRSWLLKVFVQRYKIDMSEAELQLSQYETLNQLFTRKLKPQARPLSSGHFYVHPADSQLVTCGQVSEGLKLQVKCVPYNLDQLLPGLDTHLYNTGNYALYYLCPTDYHRVHSPVSGVITRVIHVPGAFWPVNAWSARYIKGLFFKNERVIIEINTSSGPVALILVAATNVGQMSLAFDSGFRQKSKNAKTSWELVLPEAVQINQGDELGTFHMGSTVVVVTSTEFAAVEPLIVKSPAQVKVRAPIKMKS